MIDDSGLDRGVIAELRELGGDELVTEIVTAYLGEANQDLATLRRAAIEGDAGALEQAAHRFKSASAGVGAATVAGYAEELHYLGRAGSTDGASAIVAALDNAWQSAEAGLRTFQAA